MRCVWCDYPAQHEGWTSGARDTRHIHQHQIHPPQISRFGSLGCQPQRDPQDAGGCDFSRRWNKKPVLRSTSILAQWRCKGGLLLLLPLHQPLAPVGCPCLALARYDLLNLRMHTPKVKAIAGKISPPATGCWEAHGT